MVPQVGRRQRGDNSQARLQIARDCALTDRDRWSPQNAAPRASIRCRCCEIAGPVALLCRRVRHHEKGLEDLRTLSTIGKVHQDLDRAQAWSLGKAPRSQDAQSDAQKAAPEARHVKECLELRSRAKKKKPPPSCFTA